jgi:hypothetical protein
MEDADVTSAKGSKSGQTPTAVINFFDVQGLVDHEFLPQART